MSNYIDDDRFDLVCELFEKGHSIREVSRIARVAKQTANKIRQCLVDIAIEEGESCPFYTQVGGYWMQKKNRFKPKISRGGMRIPSGEIGDPR